MNRAKVLYLPLDDRACNWRVPGMLADITQQLEVVAPPAELLNKMKIPADVDKLWAWVFEQAVQCRYMVASVDMLVYGSILASRLHHKTTAECDRLLENFVRLRTLHPQLKIRAFNLVARVAAYNSSTEDPDYWETHGWDIWRHAFLTDKCQRGHASDEEKAELEKLQNSIPAEYLADFLARRKVDRYVNLRTLDLVESGVFDDLVIPKDDTAEYGYAAMDQQAIAEKVYEKKLMDKVMVYPGADEVGSVLLSRVLTEETGMHPRVYVRYSSLEAPFVVPSYEDRPLHESIRAQLTSAGCILVDTPAESDMMLAVHLQGGKTTEAAFQAHKQVTYHSRGCPHEFFRYIRYYKETYHGTVALADVCFSNGADMEMMEHCLRSGTLDCVDAYGGWNTAMNTTGMVIAHGVVHTYLLRHPSAAGLLDSQRFLARKLVEDWIYQARMYADACAHPEDYYTHPFDAYKLGENEEPVRRIILQKIEEGIRDVLGEDFRGHQILVRNFRFPWGRLFDVDFDIELQ